MKFLRLGIKAGNALLNLVIILCLCGAGAYALYALWDNSQVYQEAEQVQKELQKYKPQPVKGEEGESTSFEELLKINPDVCAWLTLDGTEIDTPVVQGDTNLTYINKNVYGKFSLSGSIFLDSRNDSGFDDPYCLLYGHHMEEHKMFGDLYLYKKASFFEKQKTGTLILPDGTYQLKIFACAEAEASDKNLFDPTEWRQPEDLTDLLKHIRKQAENLDQDLMKELEETAADPIKEVPKILAMSTCSSDKTEARTVLLAIMEKEISPSDQ